MPKFSALIFISRHYLFASTTSSQLIAILKKFNSFSTLFDYFNSFAFLGRIFITEIRVNKLFTFKPFSENNFISIKIRKRPF